MMNIYTIFLIVLMTVGSSGSEDDINTGPDTKTGLNFTASFGNFDYEVDAPDNWIMDVIKGGAGKINTMFFPESSPLFNVPAIMHIEADARLDKDNGELMYKISQDISAMDSYSPFMTVTDAENIDIKKGKSAILKYYSDDSLGIYLAKAYLEETAALITFTLSVNDKALFERYKKSFKELIKSYRTKTKNPENTNAGANLKKELADEFSELSRAYNTGSVSGLSGFFNSWSEKYFPVSMLELDNSPAYVRHAYDIASNIIDLRNLGTNFDNSWRIYFYENLKYILIQNELTIILRKSKNKTEEIKIKDFRPDVKIHGIKNIKFDEDFRNVTERFIGRQATMLNKLQLQYPDWAEKEIIKRKNFLNTNINIYESKWGGFFIYPQPYIISIEFNENLTKAIIKYKVSYLRETAIFEYINGAWNYNKYPSVWID